MHSVPDTVCFGGGLRKMEPKELMRTPAKGIANLLVGRKKYQQLSLFGW